MLSIRAGTSGVAGGYGHSSGALIVGAILKKRLLKM
jgi:hypothetical protein